MTFISKEDYLNTWEEITNHPKFLNIFPSNSVGTLGINQIARDSELIYSNNSIMSAMQIEKEHRKIFTEFGLPKIFWGFNNFLPICEKLLKVCDVKDGFKGMDVSIGELYVIAFTHGLDFSKTINKSENLFAMDKNNGRIYNINSCDSNEGEVECYSCNKNIIDFMQCVFTLYKSELGILERDLYDSIDDIDERILSTVNYWSTSII